MQYGHFAVTDAMGRGLPARLSVTGQHIAITADLVDAVYPVTVDPFIQLTRLTASNGASGDGFGFRVAMSGDGTKVVVGAWNKQIGANANQGAAYVYSGVNYITETKLTASDGAANDDFGGSVAMSGDGTRIVVGSVGKVGANAYQGAAYVYSGTNYAIETKLTASNGATLDLFGISVAMSGDGTKVVVGADNKQVGANANQGEAYVYSGTNYATETKLTASDGATLDSFGNAVGISGDGTRVVVGAPSKQVGTNANQGAAYVYSGATYGTETKLTSSDGAARDSFGISVAMSGDGTKVVVGSPYTKIGANIQQGAAYVYSGANYATEMKLTSSDGAPIDYFGTSVAMSGDGTRVVVGAWYKQFGANNYQGEAYVYSGPNYATETRLLASDGAANDGFGVSAQISGDGTRVVIGAVGKQVGANTGQGAAYIFVTPASLPTPAPTGAPKVGAPAPLPLTRNPTGPPQMASPAPLPPSRP